jgi:hypothetical protein
MTLAAVIDALALPSDARVDQRVPKKLLLEQGVPTAADKRQIQDGLEELRWVAALKPSTVGVPEYRDRHREYLEIAVLTLALRPEAKSARLSELVHRAIPYPVVLVASQRQDLTLSLAHKRYSQNEAGATVLDGHLVSTPLTAADQPLYDGLAIRSQPRTHLMALYQGWIEWIEALRASRVTGRFARASSPEATAARREALGRYQQLQREIAGFRAQATKETQVNRRVELNLTIRHLEAELAEATGNL